MHRHQFGNPETIVANAEIRRKGCRVCARAKWALGHPYCPHDKRFPSCRRDRKKGFKLIEVDE